MQEESINKTMVDLCGKHFPGGFITQSHKPRRAPFTPSVNEKIEAQKGGLICSRLYSCRAGTHMSPALPNSHS